MIKIENFEVVGIEHAIRGMRNPMNSWEKSDSYNGYFIRREVDSPCSWSLIESPSEEDLDDECVEFIDTDVCLVGPNDLTLMKKLAAGGSVHAKYRRMIVVYLDITAPLYWWKEFDTYKVGTVANSCSTMHKIHDKQFTLEDFSCEHLTEQSIELMGDIVNALNGYRAFFIAKDDKRIGLNIEMDDNLYTDYKKKLWWQMIQLLPSSYNQKRTIMLNYEVLTGIYESRKNHKLDEWREFCKWIEQLPYSEIITVVRDIDMSKIRQKNYGTKEE